MASGAKKTGSKVFVWVILVLLIVGLAGFGATSFNGTVNSVGTVGEREISVQRYARELQNQIAGFSNQLGTNVTLAQAQQFGIPQRVLAQLAATVAIENEATQMGLSAGDEQVRTQLLQIPAFQGLDGQFDRESYRFALQNSGLNEGEFEENLRAEIARTLLQGAVAGGVETPDAFVDALVSFVGERRSFVWGVLGADQLDGDLPTPTDADLRSYFDANEADFMLAETKSITYAWLTPDMIVDSVTIDEEGLRAEYDLRIDEFVRPERRLVERLILGDAAAEAKARLDAGELTFEELVAERELALADIDLGDMTEAALGEAGAAVFALAEPGITDPIPTDLGMALYRINAILAAQDTPFEDARASLIDAFALDTARRDIDAMLDDFDDLLAGGATLEELPAETDMQLGQIEWTAASDAGIAGYSAFRTAAAAAVDGDFPEIIQLDDGGIFALRVDEIIPPRLQDFADAQTAASSGWIAQETARRLTDQAEAIATQLRDGTEIDPNVLTLSEPTELTREGFVPETPADFLPAVFEMEDGEIRVLQGETAAYLIRLDGIAPPDTDDSDLSTRSEALAQATAQSIGTDILQAYSLAIEAEAGISINQVAINAVHAQFP